MAKTCKKHKRSESNLRQQAMFCGIKSADSLGVRKLTDALHKLTGTSTFHQYILKNGLGEDWEHFKDSTGNSDRRSSRRDKDRARLLASESGKPLTSEEWEDSLLDPHDTKRGKKYD